MADDNEKKRIPIKRPGIAEAPLVFANDIVVQHTQHEFFISFGHVQPPLALEEGDLDGVESINAATAVRIVLPPTRVRELIDVLNRNFETYMKGLESSLEDDESE